MPKRPGDIEPIDAAFEDVVAAMVTPAATPPAEESPPPKDRLELVAYHDPHKDEPITFRLDSETESIWATQAQIAQVFDTDISNVSRHLKNIFSDGELDSESNLQKLQIDGSSKPYTLYSLDAVISVGYRVNSKAATRFRQWATQTLKAYVEQGYVINERALRDSPEKLNRLAAEVRALRAGEKQVYAKVRECFKIGSSDYDPKSQEVKRFYALLQDKFHHAVTGSTSSKLIMDRADHRVQNMGVQHFEGARPSRAEALVGKNYLDKEELYRLHLLSEQFLLYVESTALMGKKMTMASLHRQLDRLLTLNDYPVFDGWRDFLKDEAIEHAQEEYKFYQTRLKLEAMGVEYDDEAYFSGEYDHLLAD